MSALWNGLLDLLGTTLSFFFDLVPSLGISIILLTILISLLLFPLTLKQTRSMRAMSEIQPEVKAIQAKHKDDREKLYAELQALYKERGVNPASGCLPLILQMPIWFALFRVLQSPMKYVPEDGALSEALTSGDTRFLGMDLLVQPNEALSDGVATFLPYVILILVVMATGYYQQAQTMARSKASGQQQGPQQMQTIMKIFPVVFAFISFQLPAGLVLYFAVSQMFRIGQQAAILRIDGHPPTAAEIEARAERRTGEPAADDVTPRPDPRPRQSRKRKKKRK